MSTEYSNSANRPHRDFPTHWGEPEGRSNSAERVEWVRRQIKLDEATGVPAARRAKRLLEEGAERMAPSVRDALVRIVQSGGLG